MQKAKNHIDALKGPGKGNEPGIEKKHKTSKEEEASTICALYLEESCSAVAEQDPLSGLFVAQSIIFTQSTRQFRLTWRLSIFERRPIPTFIAKTQ